ncbi:MAG: chromosome partitioning protein ParB [Actinobacteria bacterium]|nr:MAG: chromosome partitioning protein ParB [Actinomycetota bacterium]
MAKRKRLTPAQPDHFDATRRAPEVKSMTGPGLNAAPNAPSTAPPIAQVAGEAATLAALDEVTGALRDARQQGRLIEALPLESVNAHYLVRDRLVQDDEELTALMTSMRARGQQTPIEVTALPAPDNGPAYGLISGWRRLNALNRLYEETGEPRFASVKALVVDPDTAQDAYVAMVEENEIRVNLSLFERANIARRAAEEGIFPTAQRAVLALYASTTRSKRSKISTFVTLVEALDSVLRYPTAIPEKLGLTLARALGGDDGLRKRIRDRLMVDPPQSAAQELRILSAAMTRPKQADPECGPENSPENVPGVTRDVASPAPLAPGEVVPGLRLRFDQGRPPRIELSGVRADEALYRALKDWLAEMQK